jgi:hypothetical protein
MLSSEAIPLRQTDPDHLLFAIIYNLNFEIDTPEKRMVCLGKAARPPTTL